MNMKQIIVCAVLFGVLTTGCQNTTPTPSTVEEFSSAFRSAYNSGDKDAIAELVDWTNVDSDLREIQLSILTIFLGHNRVTNIASEPFDPNTPNNPINGREIELNICPTHMILIEHEGNAGFKGGRSSGSATMPIGVKNGRYFFCGWTYKEVD